MSRLAVLSRLLPASRRWRVVTAVLVVLAVVALVLVGTSGGGDDDAVRSTDQKIEVAAGPGEAGKIPVDTRLFLPDGGGPAPAVLLAHGFGGTKDSVQTEAKELVRAGYVVLTWSARGFGASGGQIALNQPDYEVADTRALIDWLATRPEVRKDAEGDPRVGITGQSYGGAISLMTAAYDPRVDAIVPQITWNDLADSLLPNATGAGADQGVFKKTWAGFFFSSGMNPLAAVGLAPPGTDPACGRFRPDVCAVYQEVARTGKATPQAVELLKKASPSSVADRIKVPTLLVQGENDSLFPLEQADRNAAAVRANGAPVEVAWQAGGHDGGPAQNAWRNGLVKDWFGTYLKGEGTQGQQQFRVTRQGQVDTETRERTLKIAADGAYPGLGGTTRRQIPLTGPEQTVTNPPGGAPTSISTVPGLGLLGALGDGSLGDISQFTGGLSLDMPGQSAVFQSGVLNGEPLTITGSSTVKVRVSGADDIVLFAKLYDVDPGGTAVLPHQLAAPVRVSGAKDTPKEVEVRLPAIDEEIESGHRLRLTLTTTDLGYATPVDPATYKISVVGPLTVPSVPALSVPSDGVPWWVWALPLAALAAAGAILYTLHRRRVRLPAPDPALAEVPLQINGLTKSYKSGKLAVEDLSFTVEKGQVLGLLGPNGAGKTTTLRMLMGLIHPDQGDIRIFGHVVTPGAPVLSRLGSFVEGPGFLPHMSGRDNLNLYWAATGRPAGDSHIDEALAIAHLTDEALDRPVRTYSQGMRGRLAIAQAMLGLPDLLVLDEPTNGLDPPQIRAMRDVIVDYAKTGRTVVVSSHLLAEIEHVSSHVVVMAAGRLVAAGPVGEIVQGTGNTLEKAFFNLIGEQV